VLLQLASLHHESSTCCCWGGTFPSTVPLVDGKGGSCGRCVPNGTVMICSNTSALQFDHTAENQRVGVWGQKWDTRTCKSWCMGPDGKTACFAVNELVRNQTMAATVPTDLIRNQMLSIEVLHRHFACRCVPVCASCHGRISGRRARSAAEATAAVCT
jgi:hypothetical protein